MGNEPKHVANMKHHLLPLTENRDSHSKQRPPQMSGVVKEPPAQYHTCCVHGNDGLQCLWGEPERQRKDELLRGSTHPGVVPGGGASYTGGCEGEHGEEDDGKFGLGHFGADGGQDGHDGARLRKQPVRLHVWWGPSQPRGGQGYLQLPVRVQTSQ